MAKKQKRATPKPPPSKRQLSKWQRQMRIRRIVVIAAAVLLAGLVSWVGYGIYKDRVAPWREVVIEVNGASFNMGYYVDMLDAYTAQETDQYMVYYMAGVVANTIVDVEVMRQHARSELGIEVSSQEITAYLSEHELPDKKVYRDIIGSLLLQEKLADYWESRLPEHMEQVHAQVMLVESEEVAAEVIAAIQAGGNFTVLVDEFSCHPQIKGDLGWLPGDLMPNTLVGNATLNMTAGELGAPIYDQSAVKSIGYWLIEVTDSVDAEDEEPEVKAKAILLGSKAEAEWVRAELIGGNFTALAKQYSQHTSKADGGELGWLERGDMDSEAFDEAAFTLALNELSDPVKDTSVQTTGGYWIVSVIDTGEAELTAEARQQLAERDFVAAFGRWKEESTIVNRLDDDKQYWAVTEVMRRR